MRSRGGGTGRLPFFGRYFFRAHQAGNHGAVYHHFIALFQAAGDNPIGTLLLGNRYFARRHGAIGIHHRYRVFLAARYRLLRHHKSIVDTALRLAHAHIQAGQQNIVGIGHFGTQSHLAGGLINRGVGKQQAAFLRIFAAAF